LLVVSVHSWGVDAPADPVPPSFDCHLGPSKEVGMNWKLEVVVIPVSDVDRAKQFYSEQLASTSTSITGWVHPFGTSS
jgi:hypothetical protein